MTPEQWKTLNRIIEGASLLDLTAGFIIDSPWLPNWYGISILDYFTSDERWFKANLHAIEAFPEAIFLPGFWSEFGMCSEPSAFGSRCTFPKDEFPHARKCIRQPEDIGSLPKPDPAVDGLPPLILNRLILNRSRIEDAGHKIYFSVSRGPLNIASYLMGTTEFLTLLMTGPDQAHALLQQITAYLKEWHRLQKEAIPTIDGIFMLDDILGFLAGEQFSEFALPYLQELYQTEASVRFLHCDSPTMEFVRYLPDIGINLLNMGFEEHMSELKTLTGNRVAMVGNLPPRDVLAAGTPADVKTKTLEMVRGVKDTSRILFSCGGGMPPGVSTENIAAFMEALKSKG